MERRPIMAVDHGMSTGVAWETPVGANSGVIDVRNSPSPRSELYAAMQSRLSRVQPLLVVFESYAYGRGGNSTSSTHQAELGGVLKAAVESFRAPWVVLPIGVWKSLTYRGKKRSKAEKERYLEKCREVTGWTPRTVDDADAFMILYAAVTIITDRSRSTQGIERFRKQVSDALNRRAALMKEQGRPHEGYVIRED